MFYKKIGILVGISLLSLSSLIFIDMPNRIEEFSEDVVSDDELFGKSILAPAQRLNSYQDIVKPKLGVQVAYKDVDDDNINDYISIRYTALVSTLDVTATWTRAMYDSNGMAFSSLKEKDIEVTKAYSAITQNGEITYANTVKDENNDTPYNYFLVYTLKNIPLSTYSDYYLDCMITLDDGNQTIKSSVGAFKVDTKNTFSYQKVDGIVAEKDGNSFTATNYPEQELVNVPTYYSNQDYRLKITSVNLDSLTENNTVKKLVLEDNVTSLTGSFTNESFEGVYYKGEYGNLSVPTELEDDVYYYSEDCKSYNTFHYIGTEISTDYTHNPLEAVVENDTATCLSSGTKDLVVYCADCGRELSRETVTSYKKEHNYSTEEENVNGYTREKHKCDYCHDTYYDSLVVDVTKNYDYKQLTTSTTYSEYSDYVQQVYPDLQVKCEEVLASIEDYEANDNYQYYHTIASTGVVDQELDSNAIMNIAYSFVMNNPQYYFLSNQVGVLCGSAGPHSYFYVAILNIDPYFFTYEARKEFQENLLLFEKDVTKNLTDNMSDYDKALLIHDYLCNNNFYQNDNGNPSKRFEAHNIVGVADMDASTGTVCEGYAKAYLYLSYLVGLESIIVVGQAGQTTKGGHAWNYTKIDDKWYGIDTTWDDQDDYILDYYFLASKSFMENSGESFSYATHEPDVCDITSDDDNVSFQVELPELSTVAYSN